ncbi:hypothetical protein BY996DRAFT_7324468, partial [Phakopsora pachyrhizi]
IVQLPPKNLWTPVNSPRTLFFLFIHLYFHVFFLRFLNSIKKKQKIFGVNPIQFKPIGQQPKADNHPPRIEQRFHTKNATTANPNATLTVNATFYAIVHKQGKHGGCSSATFGYSFSQCLKNRPLSIDTSVCVIE